MGLYLPVYDGTVGVVTSLRPWRQKNTVQVPAGATDYLFSKMSKSVLGPNQPLMPLVLGALPPG